MLPNYPDNFPPELDFTETDLRDALFRTDPVTKALVALYKSENYGMSLTLSRLVFMIPSTHTG